MWESAYIYKGDFVSKFVEMLVKSSAEGVFLPDLM